MKVKTTALRLNVEFNIKVLANRVLLDNITIDNKSVIAKVAYCDTCACGTELSYSTLSSRLTFRESEIVLKKIQNKVIEMVLRGEIKLSLKKGDSPLCVIDGFKFQAKYFKTIDTLNFDAIIDTMAISMKGWNCKVKTETPTESNEKKQIDKIMQQAKTALLFLNSPLAHTIEQNIKAIEVIGNLLDNEEWIETLEKENAELTAKMISNYNLIEESRDFNIATIKKIEKNRDNSKTVTNIRKLLFLK